MRSWTPIVSGSIVTAVVTTLLAQGPAPGSAVALQQRNLALLAQRLLGSGGQSAGALTMEDALSKGAIDLDGVARGRVTLDRRQHIRLMAAVTSDLKPIPISNGVLKPLAQDDVLAIPPAFLKPLTAELPRIAASVGRIESHVAGAFLPRATGFVAGPGIVATNCHVLPAIADLDPARRQWHIRGDVRISFVDTMADDASREFKITGVAAVGGVQGFDVALLTVDRLAVSGALALPGPIEWDPRRPAQVSLSDAPSPVEVGIVGYPNLQRAADPVFTRLRPTGLVKLYSPGAIVGTHAAPQFELLMHVANTDVGSSGSPIIRLDGMRVIGVHHCCTAAQRTDPPDGRLPCGDKIYSEILHNEGVSSADIATRQEFAKFWPAPAPPRP